MHRLPPSSPTSGSRGATAAERWPRPMSPSIGQCRSSDGAKEEPMMRNNPSPARRTTTIRLASLLIGGLLLGATGIAGAQMGGRAVKIILPVATASGVDTITRAAQPALSKALGHPIVVDNQPGAGGIVGTSALVRSPPDGMTLSIVSNN